MSWRVAGSLIKLRDQINVLSPRRSKASDGTIGDDSHKSQGSASDHNPNAANVVTAMDITNDPASGVDVQSIADSIAASRDARVKYLIFNDRIMVPSDTGWKWVFHYEGSHRQHLHISVWGDYDNQNKWSIGEEVKLTLQQVDRALKMGLQEEPSPAALNDKKYQDDAGLLIDTLWNNGGKQIFDAKKKRKPFTVSHVDKLLKMGLRKEPTAKELGDKNYLNDPALLVDTVWNNGGKASYESTGASKPTVPDEVTVGGVTYTRKKG